MQRIILKAETTAKNIYTDGQYGFNNNLISAGGKKSSARSKATRMLFLSTFILIFFTACKDDNTLDLNNNPIATINEGYISDGYKNSYITTSYNNQEHYGYWYTEFMNQLGANYEDYIVLNGDSVNVDSTLSIIADSLAAFINVRMNSSISAADIKLMLQNSLSRIIANDTSSYVLESPVVSIRFKYYRDRLLSIANSDTSPAIVIDSTKSLERDIFQDTILVVNEKELLFELTALIKYSTAHEACVMGDSVAKIENMFAIGSKYCCCCGPNCFCYNAFEEMMDRIRNGAMWGAIGGALGGPSGVFAGYMTGASAGFLDWLIDKRGWWKPW